MHGDDAEASPLRTQAEALLTAARAEHVAEELAIVRVLLLRLLRATHEETAEAARTLFKETKLIYQGGDDAATLLRTQRELDPDPQEQRQAIIFAALDALSEEWGLPL